MEKLNNISPSFIPTKLSPGPTPNTRPVHVRPGYEPLFHTLTGALERAQDERGPLPRASGGISFHTAQAGVKLARATGLAAMGRKRAARRALLDVINHVADAIIRMGE